MTRKNALGVFFLLTIPLWGVVLFPLQIFRFIFKLLYDLFDHWFEASDMVLAMFLEGCFDVVWRAFHEDK